MQHTRIDTKDQILLLVKSKRVAVGIDEVNTPLAMFPFGVRQQKERRVFYEQTLDEEQEAAVKIAGEAARQAGLKLVVEDVSRANPLLKAFRRLIGSELACDAMLLLPRGSDATSLRKKLLSPTICIMS